MKDQFLTLESSSEGYYMERGSKFLAHAFPVQSEEEALSFFQKIKKDHPKAKHYCTAIRLNPDASLERSSDDGEPSGSAGRPILGQIIKNNLTNVYIVVVRYFGGTKLGIPGLIEAYKTSAANAIAAGKIIQRSVYAKVRIRMGYDAFPSFLNFCKQQDIPVFDQSFSETVVFEIGYPKSNVERDLLKTLSEFSQLELYDLVQYEKSLDMQIEIRGEQVIV